MLTIGNCMCKVCGFVRDEYSEMDIIGYRSKERGKIYMNPGLQQVEIRTTNHAGDYMCKIGGLAREGSPEMHIIDYRSRERGKI